jgi:CheY-like chemotaxis protein
MPPEDAGAVVSIVAADAALRRSLAEMRCPSDYVIEVVSSIAEAVRAAGRTQPSLILCDLELDPARKQRALLRLRSAGGRCPIMMSSTPGMLVVPTDGLCVADLIGRMTATALAA